MKKKVLRILGIIMMVCGFSVLSLFTYRKISRELYLRKLLDDNIHFEIPQLHIKVPVLEGTDRQSLQVSAGLAHSEKEIIVSLGITVQYMLRYSMTLTRFRLAMRCISLMETMQRPLEEVLQMLKILQSKYGRRLALLNQ